MMSVCYRILIRWKQYVHINFAICNLPRTTRNYTHARFSWFTVSSVSSCPDACIESNIILRPTRCTNSGILNKKIIYILVVRSIITTSIITTTRKFQMYQWKCRHIVLPALVIVNNAFNRFFKINIYFDVGNIFNTKIDIKQSYGCALRIVK